MRRSSQEIAERRMWRDAFCASFSHQLRTTEQAGRDADAALKEFRKRYGPLPIEADDLTSLLVRYGFELAEACGIEVTNAGVSWETLIAEVKRLKEKANENRD